MKRILILNHNQEGFGTYFRCLFLGKGLSRRGYKITMLCASGGKFDLLVRRKKINENFSIITLPRIKYHEYFTGQLLFRLPLALFFVLFSSYDICYAFTVAQPQIGLPAMIAKVLRKKKLIVDWDDLWGGGFADEHTGIVARVLGWSERYFIKFADKITYVSELIGQQIEKLNLKIEKIKIPNGANIEQIPVLDRQESRKRLGLEVNKTYLVSVGNTYTDSLGIMLEAFREVANKISNVNLIMVGEGKITDKFRNLFKSLKDKIIVTGKKPFSDVPFYLSCADVLLLPMDNNNVEKARFPMRFGDYLCAGRPIISNAVGEVKYYVEKYQAGLYSESENPHPMAQNILKILDEKEISDRISQNARNLAEKELNWEFIFNKLRDEVISKI